MRRTITQKQVEAFKSHLISEEKSPFTIAKYIRDVKEFALWICQDGKGKLDKNAVLAYKSLLSEKYAPASVNSILASINGFFSYNEWFELRVKSIRIQRQIFSSDEKELSKTEYAILLSTAREKKNERLYLLMQTICSTGIRVSELKFITVESIHRARADIFCKGKSRTVFLPKQLCKMLKRYVFLQKIKSGAIFITKNGNPLDRSNIWSDMKKLCKEAGVSETKVFPHNLRHLFARTYYSLQKDIVRLADILGHTSINTTRIYTMESGEIHRKQIQKLGLLQFPQNDTPVTT